MSDSEIPEEVAASPTPSDGRGNLTRRTLGGFSWTIGLRILGLGAQLAYTAVMARLLTPEAFGLVASAQVVLLAGQILAELGIGRALVQKDELTQREIRAGFTAAVILGGLLTTGVFLGAPLVARLFDDPGVEPVTRGLAFLLLATTVGVTADSLLLRDLRFKAAALLELATFVIAYLGVGIGLALAGAGVYSLVAAAVSKAVLQSIGSLLLARHDMRPLLAWGPVRSLYAFGSKVSLISVVEYLTLAAPPTVIGRFQGQASLGQFNQGNRIVELPFTNLSQALSDVLFPAVSRIKHDRARVGGVYLTALRVTSALLLPTAAGVAVASDELVEVFLGEQWGPAASILPVLAFHAAIMMLTYYAGVVCEALGILWAKLAIQVMTLSILLTGFVVLRRSSLLVLVAVMLVARLTRLVAYWWVMGRELHLSPTAQPRALAESLAGSVVVAAAIAGWTAVASATDLTVALTLAGQMGTGAVALGLSILYGPLRPARDDMVNRLEVAGLDDGGAGGRRLLTILRSGQHDR